MRARSGTDGTADGDGTGAGTSGFRAGEPMMDHTIEVPPDISVTSPQRITIGAVKRRGAVIPSSSTTVRVIAARCQLSQAIATTSAASVTSTIPGTPRRQWVRPRAKLRQPAMSPPTCRREPRLCSFRRLRRPAATDASGPPLALGHSKLRIDGLDALPSAFLLCAHRALTCAGERHSMSSSVSDSPSGPLLHRTKPSLVR